MSPCKNLPLKVSTLTKLDNTCFHSQVLIDQLVEDVKHVRPAVEKTRPNVAKNPDVDRLEEDVNRMAKRWGNCCMQVRSFGFLLKMFTHIFFLLISRLSKD